MIIALSTKTKLELIDGTAKEPSKTNSSYHSWKLYNNIVVSCIVHFIFGSIRKKAFYGWKKQKKSGMT